MYLRNSYSPSKPSLERVFYTLFLDSLWCCAQDSWCLKSQQAAIRRALSPGHPILNRSNCKTPFSDSFMYSCKIYGNFCFVSHQKESQSYQEAKSQIYHCDSTSCTLVSRLRELAVAESLLSSLEAIPPKQKWYTLAAHCSDPVTLLPFCSRQQKKRTCIQHFLSIKCTLKSLKGKKKHSRLNFISQFFFYRVASRTNNSSLIGMVLEQASEIELHL